MAREPITIADIKRAAKRLGCDEASIRAVIDVESGGAGFLGDGRPKILFEAHHFSRLTGHAYDRSHPDISSLEWNRALYVGGAGEYMRLYRALQLNADAAIQACSWGMFQIMGFNWKACGERSLLGFLMGMHNDEGAHLDLFCAYVISEGLQKPLRNHSWAEFAREYNGRSYAANHYDTKLAAAWRAHGGR